MVHGLLLSATLAASGVTIVASGNSAASYGRPMTLEEYSNQSWEIEKADKIMTFTESRSKATHGVLATFVVYLIP